MRFADYDITPSPLPNDGLMFADLVAKAFGEVSTNA